MPVANTRTYELQTNEVEVRIPTPTPTSADELSCIISKPLDESKGTLRAAMLMHGMGAHKNGCYQSKLARKLSSQENMYVIRFDFRNCGGSSKTGNNGRTLQNDIQDMNTVYAYLTNGGFEGKKLFVDTLVGHSRGVVDMFNWQWNNPEFFVPNLVACAGRYIGSGLTDSIKAKHPDYEEKGGNFIQGFQDGEYRDVWIPRAESESLGVLNMDIVKKITRDSDTLCVYGTRENVIPLEDAAMYTNALKERNTLVLVPGADHCFRGVDVAPEGCGKPLKNGLIDYTGEVADKIAEWVSTSAMQKRFYEKSYNIDRFLPRWTDLGNTKIRDIGGWETNDNNTVMFGRAFRANYGSQIREDVNRGVLGDVRVFDLSMGDKNPNSLIGDKLPAGVFSDPSKLADDYIKVFPQVISLCQPLFEHLSGSDVPVLYFCSNGRDVSGLVTMVLLRLAGVDPLRVAQEYSLSNTAATPTTAADILPVLNLLRDRTAVESVLQQHSSVSVAAITDLCEGLRLA